MKTLRAYWFFYQKILIPTSALSICTAILVDFNLRNLAISYLFWSVFFHYIIYEVRSKNEYYFYANLGISRKILWKITISLSLILSLIFLKL